MRRRFSCHAGDSPRKRERDRVCTVITPFHAKYFACALTRRCPSDSVQKLAASLADAQVDLNRDIKDTKREAQLAASLETKIALHQRVKELASQRSEKRRGLFEAQDAVDARKDALLTEVEERLQQTVTRAELFTARWRLA